MLSSQTKDEIVAKAMVKLKENGLTINNVIETPQEEIAKMIFPVGFWNVGQGRYRSLTVLMLYYYYDDRKSLNMSKELLKFSMTSLIVTSLPIWKAWYIIKRY